MAAMTNLASKLSRAICAYLVSNGIDQKQVYTLLSTKDRTFDNGPIVTAVVAAGAANPKLTGDYKFKVHLQIDGTATNGGNAGAGEQQRVAFDALVGQVHDALMQSDDDTTLEAAAAAINAAGRALAVAGDAATEAAKEDWRKAAYNADMADFTVTEWEDVTFGISEAEDCRWRMSIVFDATACGSNVD